MRRAGFWAFLGLSAVLLSGGGRAEAFQGFRCGTGRLVREGDPPSEVQERCGDPDFADTREEQRTVRRTVWTEVNGVPIAREIEVIVSVLVDEWTYDLGPNRFIRHLVFEQGRLVKVWTGGRGNGH